MQENRVSRTATPREPPLGRIGLLLAMLGVIVAAACVSKLRNCLLFPTGFWNTDSGLFDLRFDAQLAALTLGIILLQLVPERFARLVVVLEGLAVISAYGARGLFWTAGLFLWFYALEIPLPKRIRLLAPLLLLGASGMLAATGITTETFLFSLLFTCRLMLYAWDKWQRGWPKGDLGDFLFHFAAPPLLAFPPYVVIIPFYGTYAKHFAPRLTLARAREAFAQVGLGLLAAVAIVGVKVWVHVPGALAVFVTYSVMILRVGALAHVAHGLLLLHGLIDRAPLDRPFLATNYVEVWSRFQVHQKDMQLAMFYTPVLLRLRRTNRYVAITGATAVTMLVGNLAIHSLSRYIYGPGQVVQHLPEMYGFFGLSFVVLAVSLCFQEWQRRTRRKPPTGILGVLYVAVTWAVTLAFTAALMGS